MIMDDSSFLPKKQDPQDPIEQLIRLREEMIQVAAVACAIVEQIDFGSADFAAPVTEDSVLTQGIDVLSLVAVERAQQDTQWGPQSHELDSWLLILGEEVGEVFVEASDMLPQASHSWHASYTDIVDRFKKAGHDAQILLEEQIFPGAL